MASLRRSGALGTCLFGVGLLAATAPGTSLGDVLPPLPTTVVTPTVTVPTVSVPTVTVATPVTTVTTPSAPPPPAPPAPRVTVPAVTVPVAAAPPPPTTGSSAQAPAPRPTPTGRPAAAGTAAAPPATAPAAAATPWVAPSSSSAPAGASSSATPSPDRAPPARGVARVRLASAGTVTVTIRKPHTCAVRRRFRVDLARTEGLVVIGRARAPKRAGVYLVTITRGSTHLRTLVVRVRPSGRTTVLRRAPRPVCSAAAAATSGPTTFETASTTWADALPAVVAATPRARGAAADVAPAHQDVAGASATESRAAPRPPFAGVGDTAGDHWGTLLMLALVLAPVVAIVVYVARFLRTPAA